MGNLYRSEEMSRCQLFLQTESAYACVAELGEVGMAQFRDLNTQVSAFQRKYVKEVRRCDEMERKLRYIEKEIIKDEIPILDTGESPDAPQPRELVDLEATFEKLEQELREVNTNAEALKKNYSELSELKHILRKTQGFFDVHDEKHTREDLRHATFQNQAMEPDGDEGEYHEIHLSGEGGTGRSDLNFVSGVLAREKMPTFEILLWRACRGNVFLRKAEIEEPLLDHTTGKWLAKVVFVIFFQGEQLKTKVKKICEGFRATLYPCPETAQERREMAVGVVTRLEDLKTVLNQTQDHRHRVLVAAAKNVRLWFTKVYKIKAIYHTLNLFNIDVTRKCLIAECWCPTADFDKIQLALKRGTEASGSTVQSIVHKMEVDEAPPTFFRTNKFTQGFQNIVDAYGVATYQEVNPAPYTIITFPFLFGVMFGDMGHGFIMFLFALFLVLKEKMLTAMRIRDEIFQTFFGGRYIILLMGLFAMYTGFIYNDIFAKSFNIFGSGWRVGSDEYFDLIAKSDKITLDPNTTDWNPESVYPMGMDPVWQLAENKLLFVNSFKMKMSVIVGITQMTFGVVLSLFNHRYFKQRMNVYCEFIPEILFLACIFVYLCIQIIIKWTSFGPIHSGDPSSTYFYSGPHCAPSLLIGLINMVMFKARGEGAHGLMNSTDTRAIDDSQTTCYLNTFYPGQTYVEAVLVVVAVLCIPCMLFIKPFLLRSEYRKRVAARMSVHADIRSGDAHVIDNGASTKDEHSAGGGHGGGHGGHGDGEFSMGDTFIHQAIHTIEFCLGCISHTASYLRLWALSLAHAELSEVLWNMVLSMAFGGMISGYAGAVLTFALFAAFACLTIAILVVMEGLSAFLHALRLHWVEFNSKFYKGEGYAFTPFSFVTVLEQALDDEQKNM